MKRSTQKTVRHLLFIAVLLLSAQAARAEETQSTILVKLKNESAQNASMAKIARASIARQLRPIASEALRLRGTTPVPQYYSFTVGSVYGQKLLDQVRRLPFVEYAEFDAPVTAFFTPNDPHYSNQWHFEKVNIEDAWDYDTADPLYGGDPSVVVAVIDTGVAYENFTDGATVYAKAPDLSSSTFTAGYDFVSNDSHPNDQNGHGTHVTGTIAERTNNSLGAAGIAFHSTIMPIRVLNRQGTGTTSDVAEGIDFAVAHGADVINLSLGALSDSQIMRDAVNAALAANSIVVAAAGNNASSSIAYPAAYPGVIGVTAIDRDDVLASYSNYGTEVSLTAPGGDGSDYVWQQTYNAFDADSLPANYVSFGTVGYQGTSQATPHVSAAAALLLARGVDSSGVAPLLKSTATDLGTSGHDSLYGYGRIDIGAAMNAFLNDSSAPSTSLSVSPSAPNGLNGYYTTKPSVTLSAQDAAGGSGVRAIEYRVGSGEFSSYTGGFSVSDGIQTIQYRASDVSGNTESAKSKVFRVDTAGPVITVKSPGIGTPTPAITVSGTVADAVSGLSGITLNGTPLTVGQNGSFSANLTLSSSEETLTLIATDEAGNQTTLLHAVALTPKERIVVGAGVGGGPQVLLYTENGHLLTNFFAYDSKFRGGVNIASGSIDQTSGDEIIAGAGFGGGPQVRLFDSQTKLTGQFFAYDIRFRGGVRVATGDLNNDNSEEIVTAPGPGGGPHIRTFSNKAVPLSQFMAFAPTARQGLSVATGDIDADGDDEIVTALGAGADPTVKVFTNAGILQRQFFAFDQGFRGGVEVASGDLDGDGQAEIIVVPQSAGGPQVRVFSGQGRLRNQFFAFSSDSRTGLTIATGDVDGNGIDEIIVGAGKGMEPLVKVFSGSGQLLYQFLAFPSFVRGGVYVAAGSQE